MSKLDNPKYSTRWMHRRRMARRAVAGRRIVDMAFAAIQEWIDTDPPRAFNPKWRTHATASSELTASATAEALFAGRQAALADGAQALNNFGGA